MIAAAHVAVWRSVGGRWQSWLPCNWGNAGFRQPQFFVVVRRIGVGSRFGTAGVEEWGRVVASRGCG